VVRTAVNLTDAVAILAEWQPQLAIVDMDHDDSAELLHRMGASNNSERDAGLGPDQAW
jgi:hypothetical protein